MHQKSEARGGPGALPRRASRRMPAPRSRIRGSERYGCEISRLTIADAGARERICTPNGKATPHRFAQARGDTIRFLRVARICGALGRPIWGPAGERFVTSHPSVSPDGWIEALFCFSLPPRVLFIRARAISAVTKTRLPQGAPYPSAARSDPPRVAVAPIAKAGQTQLKRNRDSTDVPFFDILFLYVL